MVISASGDGSSSSPNNQTKDQTKKEAREKERARKEFQQLLTRPPVPVIIRLLEQAQTYTSPYRQMSDIFDRFLEIALFCLDGRGRLIEDSWEKLRANPELAAQVDPGQHTFLLMHYHRRISDWHKLIRGFSEKSLGFLTQALTVLVYQAQVHQDYRDYIGAVYMQLGQANKWAGQFFTPWEVAYVTSQMTLVDVTERPQEKPLSINDPACGSGVMLMAAAAVVAANNPALIERGLLELYGQDIDHTCVLMAQLNMRLHGLDSWTICLKREAWRLQQAPAQAASTPLSPPAALQAGTETVKLYSELTEAERRRIENTTGQSVAELQAQLRQTRQLTLEGFELPLNQPPQPARRLTKTNQPTRAKNKTRPAGQLFE
ncbi:unnamed protein product [Didymodactylos carnosus]|uniref:site-specific DNA-methyltransferase (adenine-specific) n=1 Tax=Didymodactylos carnosus TaxID=1234261 RepID=A0A815ZRK7_9BILA|nr:unnamed protein product [Didymodactylos carnosus]CAF4458960.1 unnamed protein product [Didymodactylos carnosus]